MVENNCFQRKKTQQKESRSTKVSIGFLFAALIYNFACLLIGRVIKYMQKFMYSVLISI